MKIKILSTPQSNQYADGGDLLGLNGVNQFNNGSSHEESPYNGIPVGINPNDGQPNLVEKGEVQYEFEDGDYIFSNRNAMGLDLINKYNLNKKFANHTPAYIAKKLQEESEIRPFDPISSNTLNENMSRLKGAQEEYNQRKQQEQAAEIVNNMSDEEKMGLLQLAQQQNPEVITGMEGLQYSMGGHLFGNGSYRQVPYQAQRSKRQYTTNRAGYRAANNTKANNLPKGNIRPDNYATRQAQAIKQAEDAGFRVATEADMARPTGYTTSRGVSSAPKPQSGYVGTSADRIRMQASVAKESAKKAVSNKMASEFEKEAAKKVAGKTAGRVALGAAGTVADAVALPIVAAQVMHGLASQEREDQKTIGNLQSSMPGVKYSGRTSGRQMKFTYKGKEYTDLNALKRQYKNDFKAKAQQIPGYKDLGNGMFSFGEDGIVYDYNGKAYKTNSDGSMIIGRINQTNLQQNWTDKPTKINAAQMQAINNGGGIEVKRNTDGSADVSITTKGNNGINNIAKYSGNGSFSMSSSDGKYQVTSSYNKQNGDVSSNIKGDARSMNVYGNKIKNGEFGIKTSSSASTNTNTNTNAIQNQQSNQQGKNKSAQTQGSSKQSGSTTRATTQNASNRSNTNASNRPTYAPVTSNNNARMWYDNNGSKDRTEGDLLIRDKNGNIDFNATYADNSDFSNRRNELAAAIDAGENRDERQQALLDQYLDNINRANPNRQFSPEDLTRKNFDRWTSDGKAGGWHMLPTDAQINSRLGNEEVPIDIPDEQEIPEDDITATAPDTENDNGENNEQLPNLGFSPYAKAPILGSMIGLSSALLKPVDYRLANDIDAASGNFHHYAPAFVGGYDRVRPESADRANNLAAAQYNNQMSVMRNTGDRNAQMAGIMALNNQYGNIFDQNIANTNARNIQDRQNVLNRANQIDQYNASAANQAMNLNANIDAQIAQNQIASAKAREDSRDARLDAIYGGINNLATNIGNYGREMDNKLLNALYMDSLAKNEKTKYADALLGNFDNSNQGFNIFNLKSK